MLNRQAGIHREILMIFIFLLSFTIGMFGAWFVYRFGNRLGLQDLPNHRSSHDCAVPKGGGVGILAAFVTYAVFSGLDKSFWLPAFILSLVSFIGDRTELKPALRLMVQFGCSLVFLGGFFYQDQGVLIYILIFPLAVFITGSANFYNFMDGINGIAGITGITGFFLLSVYGYMTDAHLNYILLSTAMAFACAGFLPFNIPKAKVFMGDIGSVLLGFVFACIVVLLSDSLLDFICLAGFLFPFYADELTTMWVRIRNKEPLKQPHRKHVYQLLANEYGITHWKISAGYGGVQLAVGIAVILLKEYGYIGVLSLLTTCFACFSVFSVILRKNMGKNLRG